MEFSSFTTISTFTILITIRFHCQYKITFISLLHYKYCIFGVISQNNSAFHFYTRCVSTSRDRCFLTAPYFIIQSAIWPVCIHWDFKTFCLVSSRLWTSANWTVRYNIWHSCFYFVYFQVMCMAGSSCKIDLCTNFSYRDQILTFAPWSNSTGRWTMSLYIIFII